MAIAQRHQMMIGGNKSIYFANGAEVLIKKEAKHNKRRCLECLFSMLNVFQSF